MRGGYPVSVAGATEHLLLCCELCISVHWDNCAFSTCLLLPASFMLCVSVDIGHFKYDTPCTTLLISFCREWEMLVFLALLCHLEEVCKRNALTWSCCEDA